MKPNTDIAANLPLQIKRDNSKPRRQITLHHDDHERLVAVADAAGCTVPTAIVALLNYYESQKDT